MYFTFKAETWILKQKYRIKLIVTEMDYLRRSSRISRLDKNIKSRQNKDKTE